MGEEQILFGGSLIHYLAVPYAVPLDLMFWRNAQPSVLGCDCFFNCQAGDILT